MKRLFEIFLSAIILFSGMMSSFVPTANAIPADAEIIRAQMLSTLQNQQALAVKLGDTTTQNMLTNAIQQANGMTVDQLLILQGVDFTAVDQAVSNVHSELDQSIANKTVPPYAVQALPVPGLSNAAYSATCSAGSRSSDLEAIASKDLLFVAEGVKEAASRACNQVAVVVVLGEGGGANGSLGCIASDAVYVAAKVAHTLLTQCDGPVDSTEILGIYNRTQDIYNTITHNHTDLMTQLAAVNANGVGVTQNGLDIAAHDVGINTVLTAQNGVQAAHNAALAIHDTALSTHDAALGTHDGDIKAAMGAQSTALFNHNLDIRATLASLRTALTIRMNRLDGAVAALNPQNQTPPQTPTTISLALNARSYTTGSVLTLTRTTQTGVPPVNADAYLALRLPDKTLVTMQADGVFGPGFSPFLSNFPVSSFTSPAVNYTFIGTEQPGSYTLIAFLTQPGTLIPIGAWVQKSFSFAP